MNKELLKTNHTFELTFTHEGTFSTKLLNSISNKTNITLCLIPSERVEPRGVETYFSFTLGPIWIVVYGG